MFRVCVLVWNLTNLDCRDVECSFMKQDQEILLVIERAVKYCLVFFELERALEFGLVIGPVLLLCQIPELNFVRRYVEKEAFWFQIVLDSELFCICTKFIARWGEHRTDYWELESTLELAWDEEFQWVRAECKVQSKDQPSFVVFLLDLVIYNENFALSV